MFQGAKASVAGKPRMKFYINLQPKLKTIVYVGEVMTKTHQQVSQLTVNCTKVATVVLTNLFIK
jgi:hypothetical protein